MDIKKLITPDLVKGQLESALEGLDDQRAGGFDRLLEVRRARGRALERGMERRLAQGGEKDPAARRMARRLERNRVAREELRPLAVLARKKPPAADADCWTVVGMALAEGNRGEEGATVTLVDAKGNKIRNAPRARVDLDGFYELKMPAKVASEREVFVQVRKGRMTRLLNTSPLRQRPGSVDFVAGSAPGGRRAAPRGLGGSIDEVIAAGVARAMKRGAKP